jgi:3'(2'), 5'-bisphosphate nucleotidase
MNETDFLTTAIKAAVEGGRAIMEIYDQDFSVEYKADKSPLTLADRNAHEVITRILEPTGLPLLSEEGKHTPYETRKNWAEFWLVDPLDGTKEFVKRNGEFTVNIALIRGSKAVMGIIYVPASGLLYFASYPAGARKLTVRDPKHFSIGDEFKAAETIPSQPLPGKLTVVGSRSHLSAETLEYIENLKSEGKEPDFVSVGSSLKLCLVAEGKAHLYPRFGPTMEWDTAAGQAIVEISGGKIVRADNGQPVVYNKPDLLNPWFIASRE